MTFAVGVLLAASSATPSWAPTVSARLDRMEAHVGDAVGLHISAVHRNDVEVKLPVRPDLGKLTLLHSSETHKDLRNGRTQTEFVLRVAAYQTGDVEIPAIQVVAAGPDRSLHAIATTPLRLGIRSLLANVPDPQPKPEAPPLPVMERDLRLVWAAAALAAVALIVAAALWVRRRLAARAKRAQAAAPPEPPHVVALRRLADLRASGLLERGDVKEFYERLSLAVRDYLGGRYGFCALDMTTLEIRVALGYARPEGLILAEVEGFLSGCDLVKFARQRPDLGAAGGALDEAVALVERTRPAEVAPAA